MTVKTDQNNPPDLVGLEQAIRKRMLQVVLQWLIMSAILFISAGTVNWPMAWALIGVQGAVLLFNSLYVLPRNPAGVAERSEIKPGTKGWDRMITTFIGIAALATLIVSGLDYRYSWSPQYALWIQLFGLAFLALGNLLFSWALASNKFFATTVRIQDERAHSVASGGPYRYVRHPGYIGYITFTMASPISLGTLWGLVPAMIVSVGMVIRTAKEDSTLQEELPGYKGYATEVRYRLLPGIW